MAHCATISATKSVISTRSNIACSRLTQETVAIDSDLTFGDWLRRQRRALDLTFFPELYEVRTVVGLPGHPTPTG